MREIKFRAWDGKRMWFSGQEGEEDEQGNTYQLYYDRDAGTYKASLLGPQFLVATDPYPMYHPGEEAECHLMQYTGVKDKNGTEIYDEDIVKYTERNLENAFGGKGEPQEEKIRIVRWFMDGWVIPKGFVKDIEVIGNCYENPELVEDK